MSISPQLLQLNQQMMERAMQRQASSTATGDGSKPSMPERSAASDTQLSPRRGSDDFEIGRRPQHSQPSAPLASDSGENIDIKSLVSSLLSIVQDQLSDSAVNTESFRSPPPAYSGDGDMRAPPPAYSGDGDMRAPPPAYSGDGDMRAPPPAYSGDGDMQAPPPSYEEATGQQRGPEGFDPSTGGGSDGGRPGTSSSLLDSRVGSGMGSLTGDYGTETPDAFDEDAVWFSQERYAGGSVGAGAGTEFVNEDGNFTAAANVGAGASGSVGFVDEEGNHANVNGSVNASAGARVSTVENEETGYRETTAGAGVGASAYVGGAIGDGDSSSGAGVAVSADMSAEASIATNSDGVPIGVSGNVGGDLGVEGELSHNKTTDVGSSGMSLTGGADIGAGAGGEFGMRPDGTFVVGAELDLGPIGGGFNMELDTVDMERRGGVIDDAWHSGDYGEAVTQTADLVLDTAETIPGMGNVIGMGRDLGYGAEKAFNEFKDGDVLGGLEALGDGYLDSMENIPIVGDGIAAARDWVTDGGLKDLGNDALDFGKDAAKEINDFGNDALDFGKDIVESLPGVKMAGTAKDVVEDVAEKAIDKGKDFAEDVGDAVGGAAEDFGDAVGGVVDSIVPSGW